jgi:hypothetical protein
MFWWLIVASPAWVLLTLGSCTQTVSLVSNISFVEFFMFIFGGFWGMCG